MEKIKTYWEQNPLTLILILAALARLVAVIFSKGYGMHDDHFLVIETAQSWLDGADYYNWFKEREFTDTPTILNFAMAGFHYILFAVLELLGLGEPQTKMFVVRVLHGAFSLLTVSFGYKIAERLLNREAAIYTGLLLAVYWFMPFFSVRNLVEVVCIPFIMWAFYILVKRERDLGAKAMITVGILLGVAFSIRFQTAILPFGAGLVMLFRRQIVPVFWMTVGFIVPVLLLHGLPDWIIWGYPFAEIKAYITHNVQHRYDYSVAPWHTYLLLLIGILIPPVSLFLLTGLFTSWKKYLLLFVPVVLFIIFHSYFPNKQERFILPVVPLLITTGIAGWMRFTSGSDFWFRHSQLLRSSWIIFWVLNIFFLSFFSTMYSKKARVESMAYLARYEQVSSLLVEDTNRDDAVMLPLFYMEQWPGIYQVTKKYPIEVLPGNALHGQADAPRFILFFGKKHLHQRVLNIQQKYPSLKYETTIQPSLMDKVMHWLNPVNANETVYIYRNTDFFPNQID